MNIIYADKLKKNLIEELCSFYIFLGEDLILLKKNQDLILHYAIQKKFLEKTTINIENNKDWKKIIDFQKQNNLFFTKKILVIDFIIKKINTKLVECLNKIFYLIRPEILIILKFNHLSVDIQKYAFFKIFQKYGKIISCFTPYNFQFVNWIKYEIQEKNIKLEKKSFLLLCKYYEGNTLFICKILDILSITYPYHVITVKRIQKIIINLFDIFPSNWINAILKGKTKKAIYIINFFYKKNYNPLFLIRAIQKYLLILIQIKRKKNIDIKMFLKKNNIWSKEHKILINACNTYKEEILFQAVKILVKIEINIKKKHNYDIIWNQLQILTLTLSDQIHYTL